MLAEHHYCRSAGAGSLLQSLTKTDSNARRQVLHLIMGSSVSSLGGSPGTAVERFGLSKRIISSQKAAQDGDAALLAPVSQSEGSQHPEAGKFVDFQDEIDGLPDKLRASLLHLKGFNTKALMAASRRPISLLAFMTILPAVEQLDGMDGLKQLPNLLGILARLIRRSGSNMQQSKLCVVQFLYCETQPTGCLHYLLRDDPLGVLALCLAALTSGVTKVKDTVRRAQTMSASISSPDPPRERGHMSHQKNNKTTNSFGGSKSSFTTNLRETAAVAQARAICVLLSRTAYFKTLPEKSGTRLLELVSEISHVADPNMLEIMLRNETLMQQSGRSERHLLQATLVVASHSHLFRKFKDDHLAWCANRATNLQNSAVTSDELTPFAFTPGDCHFASVRFSTSQVWTIENVMLPFTCLWARMVGGSRPKELCMAVARMARTYEMTYKAPCMQSSAGPGGNALLHSSVPIRQFKSDAPPVEKMILSGDVKCPFVDRCKGSVPLPEDVPGMLSVCRMYNVNAETLTMRARAHLPSYTNRKPDPQRS